MSMITRIYIFLLLKRSKYRINVEAKIKKEGRKKYNLLLLKLEKSSNKMNMIISIYIFLLLKRFYVLVNRFKQTDTEETTI